MNEIPKYFTVRAMRVEDEQKALILENLINRPSIVSAIMDEVEKQLKIESNMAMILFGTGNVSG